MTAALVTGAAGFLGRYLVRALTECGWRVRGFDLRPPVDADPGVEWRVGDIRVPAALEEAACGVDVVFHLASLIPQRKADAETMRAVNVNGTATVLATAQAVGAKRVVYLSSAEVYGIPGVSPCSEEAPLRPLAEYGRNKVAAEALCHAAGARGLATVILRPPTIVGPGLLEPFLLDLLRSLRANRPVLLLGQGRNCFHFVHAQDVASACVAAAERAEAVGGTFNIAGPDPLPIREIAEAVVARSGSRSKVITLPTALARPLIGALDLVGKAPLEPEHLAIALAEYVFDISKARAQLGWSPRYGVIEALLESYAAMDTTIARGRL